MEHEKELIKICKKYKEPYRRIVIHSFDEKNNIPVRTFKKIKLLEEISSYFTTHKIRYNYILMHHTQGLVYFEIYFLDEDSLFHSLIYSVREGKNEQV